MAEMDLRELKVFAHELEDFKSRVVNRCNTLESGYVSYKSFMLDESSQISIK